MFSQIRTQFRLIEKLSDWNGSRELFLLIFAGVVVYLGRSTRTNLVFLENLSELFFVIGVYGLLVTYNYGSLINRGMLGHIYTFPVDRKLNYFLSIYYESFIVAIMFTFIVTLEQYFTTSVIDFNQLFFFFIVSFGLLCLVISVGRIFAMLMKEGLGALGATGLFFIVSELIISIVSINHPFIRSITCGFVNGVSNTELSAVYIEIVVSVVVSVIGIFVQKKMNFRNGR